MVGGLEECGRNESLTRMGGKEGKSRFKCGVLVPQGGEKLGSR